MAVLEITRFRLADGANVDDLLSAEAHVQTAFYYQQAGLLRRTTARGEGRTWVDVVLWASPERAAAGQEAAASSPAVAALEAVIDPASVAREMFETID